MARPARSDPPRGAPARSISDRTRADMQPAQIAEAVRAACEQAAMSAYEDAGLRGLCEAGRWEAAVGALQSLDLQKLIQALERTGDGPD